MLLVVCIFDPGPSLLILSNFAVPDSAVHPMESRELRLDPSNCPFFKLCSDPCWPDSQRERPNDPWKYMNMPQIVTIEIKLNISTCCLVHRISNLFSGWAVLSCRITCSLHLSWLHQGLGASGSVDSGIYPRLLSSGCDYAHGLLVYHLLSKWPCFLIIVTMQSWYVLVCHSNNAQASNKSFIHSRWIPGWLSLASFLDIRFLSPFFMVHHVHHRLFHLLTSFFFPSFLSLSLSPFRNHTSLRVPPAITCHVYFTTRNRATPGKIRL